MTETTGPESRDRIRSFLQSSNAPVTVEEIAEQTGLHANTVRGHLEVLLAGGQATREPAGPAGRGRPKWLYTASGASVSAFQFLAEALTVQLSRADRPSLAEEAAHRWADALPTLPEASSPDEAVAEKVTEAPDQSRRRQAAGESSSSEKAAARKESKPETASRKESTPEAGSSDKPAARKESKPESGSRKESTPEAVSRKESAPEAAASGAASAGAQAEAKQPKSDTAADTEKKPKAGPGDAGKTETKSGNGSDDAKPAAKPEGRLLPWEPVHLPEAVKKDTPPEPKRDADSGSEGETPRESG